MLPDAACRVKFPYPSRVLLRVSACAASLLIVACASPPAVPTAVDIFEPDPNYDFNAASGVVEVHALDGRTVCFTLDGSEPEYADGTCTGGTTAALAEDRRITLRCADGDLSTDSIVGVRIAFEWPSRSGKTVVPVSANFTLDCTQVVVDRDSDGVPDAMDNCPVDPNADQADANQNGIGDACENSGAPDADGDGRPDTADNCVNVWNVNQGDDDRDGIGNVCDPTPRGTPPLPWDNVVLARAFVKWKDELQCRLNNCSNPTGTGNWMTGCDGSGTETWNVSLNGLRAISKFTYANCSHAVTVDVHDWATDPMNVNPAATVPLSITLVGNGELTQDTDFNGSGNESGTVRLTGDFTGTVNSHVLINNASRAGGSYFSVACTADPIAQEMCAPNNLFVNFVYPDWSCEAGGCPPPPPPLMDTDGDGVFDPYDNCVSIANASQANVDFDAQGDACDSSSNTTDTDGDRVPDDSDNCPAAANPTQQDSDHDGLGDACDSVVDPDTDGDLIIDSRDNCPMNANAGQEDADHDGAGDVCDSTPNGQPAFSLIKFKLGRCLYDNGGDARSTSACDPGQPNQRWEVTTVSTNRFVFRNVASGLCLNAETWTGVIGMANCSSATASQQWDGEAYTTGGLDPKFPMRLHSAAPTYNYCAYTDFTADVFATQGNCGLLGTEDNRKIGIYAGGDFSLTPPQP
jgi:hypothetical protein